MNVSSAQQVSKEIDILIRARCPLIYVVSHEEERVVATLAALAQKQDKPLQLWSATDGLRACAANGRPGQVLRADVGDPTAILQLAQETQTAEIYLLKDFHPYLQDHHIIRRLRDVVYAFKASYKTLILLSPTLVLPQELEKDVAVVDFPLPDFDAIAEILHQLYREMNGKGGFEVRLTKREASQLIRAAQGLTLSEAESAFAKSIVDDGLLGADDISRVLKEKEQVIRKSQILEYCTSPCRIEDIGGLDQLKLWLLRRKKAMAFVAKDSLLPAPRGLLLLGAPGCGKSLTAKAVASAWSLPLLRLDFGKIYSGLVGSSEDNLRRVLKVAESVAPAVLWVDEIEKGLSGLQGAGDGGTSARVVGTFLTWMQEKQSQVFVVATANKIESLPPELFRRGRFDEIFFVDLPNPLARKEILAIHLRRFKVEVATSAIDALARACDGFSGAEIEHGIIEAMYAAFAEQRQPTENDVKQAFKEIIPLSVTYADDISRLRSWASHRARPSDSTPAAEPVGTRVAHVEVRR